MQLPGREGRVPQPVIGWQMVTVTFLSESTAVHGAGNTQIPSCDNGICWENTGGNYSGTYTGLNLCVVTSVGHSRKSAQHQGVGLLRHKEVCLSHLSFLSESKFILAPHLSSPRTFLLRSNPNPVGTAPGKRPGVPTRVLRWLCVSQH